MSVKLKLLRLAGKRNRKAFDDFLVECGFTQKGAGIFESPVTTAALLVAIPVGAAVVASTVGKKSAPAEIIPVETKPLANMPEVPPASDMVLSNATAEAKTLISHNDSYAKATSYHPSTKAQESYSSNYSTISGAFARHNVPIGLSNIVFFESGAGTCKRDKNGMIRSSAGAMGIWQFMPKTGAEYGLNTPEDFMDWEKSSDAAARYMRKLYDSYFGCWDLVVMAYNCGPGNVLKAMRRAGIDTKRHGDFSKDEIWATWLTVPDESKKYYLMWLSLNGGSDAKPIKKSKGPIKVTLNEKNVALTESTYNQR